MVPGSSTTASMLATALLAVVPGSGVPASGIADFLTTIGGDTEIRTSGSMLSDPSPQLYPLARDGSEIIGYRFFAEKLAANGSATAERAKAAFAQECAAKGGHIEPEGGTVARGFRERVLGRRLPPRGSYKHFWSGVSAVCARSPSEVMTPRLPARMWSPCRSDPQAREQVGGHRDRAGRPQRPPSPSRRIWQGNGPGPCETDLDVSCRVDCRSGPACRTLAAHRPPTTYNHLPVPARNVLRHGCVGGLPLLARSRSADGN